MKTLYLTLMREFFDQIFEGTKKVEYRDIKPYWTTRLFDENKKAKKFDVIEFKNGYFRNARKMIVEWKGVRVNKEGGKYEILLGDVLS